MSSHIEAVLSTAVPIILLVGLGAILRITQLLSEQGLQDLKKLVVYVALPAVLFRAFLTMDFDTRHMGLLVAIPAILTFLYVVGLAFSRVAARDQTRSRANPFLMTGFEFGMLGISLFGTAYGMQAIGAISVLGLPHELFIWFIYVTLLKIRYGNRTSAPEILVAFFRSPVIIAIVSGALLNALNAGPFLAARPGSREILLTLEMLGTLIGPLILIIVGYGMRISRAAIAEALPLIAVRLSITVLLGLTLAPWLVQVLLGLPVLYTRALFTLLILPPPFIVPLFIPPQYRSDLTYVHNVLSVYTLCSIILFLGYVSFA